MLFTKVSIYVLLAAVASSIAKPIGLNDPADLSKIALIVKRIWSKDIKIKTVVREAFPAPSEDLDVPADGEYLEVLNILSHRAQTDVVYSGRRQEKMRKLPEIPGIPRI